MRLSHETCRVKPLRRIKHNCCILLDLFHNYKAWCTEPQILNLVFVSDYTECPTCYRTRHLFNNSNTNEDIATKFEQEYVRCVRNEEECVCSVRQIFIHCMKIVCCLEVGAVDSWGTPCEMHLTHTHTQSWNHSNLWSSLCMFPCVCSINFKISNDFNSILTYFVYR